MSAHEYLTALQVARWARTQSWPHNDVVTAVAISFAENGRHDARANFRPGTGEDSLGLWQINIGGPLWRDRQALARAGGWILSLREQLFDPHRNVEIAAAIARRAGGFGDWSTYLDHAYEKHLSEANIAVHHASLPKFVLHRYLYQKAPMMNGFDVAHLQAEIGAPVDDWFGPITNASLVDWQGRHVDAHGSALVKDGVVGPLTAGALGWNWEPTP
jgi:Lysozyme like domain